MRHFRNTIAHGLIAASLPLLLLGCTTAQPAREMFPGIRWDQRNGLISIDGAVCLDRGILEYVAVAEGGKEYESVFRLHCRPAYLHQVMLMAGYQPSVVTDDARGDYAATPDAPQPRRPAAAPPAAAPPDDYWKENAPPQTYVAIDVEVEQPGGKWERRPIESLLIQRSTGQPPKELRWVFTGSFFAPRGSDGTQVFAADVNKSVVALWYDPSALLNPIEDVGNPYRGEFAGLEVNPAALPPRDTPVHLVLHRVAPNTHAP